MVGHWRRPADTARGKGIIVIVVDDRGNAVISAAASLGASLEDKSGRSPLGDGGCDNGTAGNGTNASGTKEEGGAPSFAPEDLDNNRRKKSNDEN